MVTILKKFLENRYLIGPRSPLGIIDTLDEDRLKKYIDSIGTILNKEIDIYKKVFGQIKSTLDDTNKRLEEIKDISNYLPKIVKVEPIDYIDDIKVSDFKPNLNNVIVKLPDIVDWVTMVKEYKSKNPNENLLNTLLDMDEREIDTLYHRYIKNNSDGVFTGLLYAAKYNTLIKLLAIVDMFYTCEPLDDARGSLDGYKALFTVMLQNIINVIKIINNKIVNAEERNIVIIDYTSEAIAVNQIALSELLDKVNNIEVVYGLYLSDKLNKQLKVSDIIPLEKTLLKTFNDFKVKTSLRISVDERNLLENIYLNFANNLNKIFDLNIDTYQLRLKLKEYNNDTIFNIEDMLIDIVQTLAFPNSNIKRFVKNIDKYLKEQFTINEARELAIYALIVDYLMKDVHKVA